MIKYWGWSFSRMSEIFSMMQFRYACKNFIDGFYHFRVWNGQLLTEIKWSCMPWIFLTAKSTLFHWYSKNHRLRQYEPGLSVNMSLIWILLCLGQPNYSYLPSDLSHMGSNQRSNLWLQWCNQAKFSEIDGLMHLCIGKLMDSRNLCIGK